jgi:protein-S-isoprenylcysteine O-methyltransferase Ste14
MTQVLVSAWAISMLLVFVARAKKEDDMLRKEFSDWDEWAKKVPYKLIPFVY